MCESPDMEDNVIARNMLRDILPCDEFDAMSRQIGFIPSSPEVNHVEHVQSHLRCEALEPVGGLIGRLASNAGHLAAAMAGCTNSPFAEEAVAAYVNMANFASFAVISQLVDLGYLKVPTP